MNKIIPDSRICHMHGVAEYMYHHAEKYGLIPDEMYVLGLFHDIGYVRGKPEHERNGADLLRQFGVSGNFADIINYHGTSPEEYMNLFRCHPSEIPSALVLLWEADMHVDQTGEDVGYEARLRDIGNRLGFQSKAYNICKETVVWLINNTSGNLSNN